MTQPRGGLRAVPLKKTTMKTLNDIKNAAARIWKSSELNTTIKQARAAGFEVIRDGEMTTIKNPVNGDVVVRSFRNSDGIELVRINKTYFEQ